MESTITIEEVARKAGVSVSTVSRTLNDKPDVATETKKRVRDAMKSLGYTPNRYASNLAGGLSRAIALLFPIGTGGVRELTLDFIVGASRALEERDFLLHVVTKEVDTDDLRVLRKKNQVDGAILMRTRLHDERTSYLKSVDFPFVMIGRCADNTDLSYVDLDFAKAIESSLRYLKNLGHRNVGFISYSPDLIKAGYTYTKLILDAFHSWAEDFSMQTTVSMAGADAESVQNSTKELIAKNPDLTAILTVYGELAPVTEYVLREAGKAVPREISLISITEDKTALRMYPALTSVSFPSEQMGYQAANILIDKIMTRSDRTAAEQVLIEPIVTERGTTGRNHL